MGALLDQFATEGVTIEPAGDGSVRARGPLTDVLRTLIRARKADILAELGDGAYREWRIRYPNGAAMTVLFVPPATRPEVANLYRGAAIEPIAEAAMRMATAAEADELRDLVVELLTHASETDQAEALAVALDDVEVALMSFRALTTDRKRKVRR